MSGDIFFLLQVWSVGLLLAFSGYRLWWLLNTLQVAGQSFTLKNYLVQSVSSAQVKKTLSSITQLVRSEAGDIILNPVFLFIIPQMGSFHLELNEEAVCYILCYANFCFSFWPPGKGIPLTEKEMVLYNLKLLTVTMGKLWNNLLPIPTLCPPFQFYATCCICNYIFFGL